MSATATPGPQPEPPPDVMSSAMALTRALGYLILAAASAPMAERALLTTCWKCRNYLLYMLDTAPYAADTDAQLGRRIRAMADHHDCFHVSPAIPGTGNPDAEMPRIRGLS